MLREPNLTRITQIVWLNKVVLFPLLIGNTHIGSESSVLGCFQLGFGSWSIGTAGKYRKQHRKAKYTTIT